jgi:hypothetical protein
MKLVSALVGLAALGGVALSSAAASAQDAATTVAIPAGYVCNEYGHCLHRHYYGGRYYHPHYWGGYGRHWGGYGWHRPWGYGGGYGWHRHWGGWGGGYGWHHWHQW